MAILGVPFQHTNKIGAQLRDSAQIIAADGAAGQRHVAPQRLEVGMEQIVRPVQVGLCAINAYFGAVCREAVAVPEGAVTWTVRSRCVALLRFAGLAGRAGALQQPAECLTQPSHSTRLLEQRMTRRVEHLAGHFSRSERKARERNATLHCLPPWLLSPCRRARARQEPPTKRHIKKGEGAGRARRQQEEQKAVKGPKAYG
eukprot:2485644-Pleurochrysis_carterae.AAC.3